MPQGLPSHSNLEFYRKQAKALLRAYRDGDVSAASRLGPSREGSTPGLSDAQHVVAREMGYASWSLLKAAVRAQQDTGEPRIPPEAGGEEPIENPLPAVEPPARTKQRYERDPNVQRWLRTGVESEADSFAPPFLREHRERDWILSSLQGFHAKGLITDVVGVVKAGKEATVYRCVGPDGQAPLAAKIYRPRMFRNLQNDTIYTDGRMPERDRRSRKAMDKKSRRGRSFRMESWIHFEFETQTRLFEAGVDVPEPLDTLGNAILMELIGDGAGAAPMLCDVDLDPAEARNQYERLMQNIELMLACDRVHADLSAYNVLYWKGRSVIIDFAQAVDARSGPDVLHLLSRDVDRLARYFARRGPALEPEGTALDLWSRYTRGALPPAATRTTDTGNAPWSGT